MIKTIKNSLKSYSKPVTKILHHITIGFISSQHKTPIPQWGRGLPDLPTPPSPSTTILNTLMPFLVCWWLAVEAGPAVSAMLHSLHTLILQRTPSENSHKRQVRATGVNFTTFHRRHDVITHLCRTSLEEDPISHLTFVKWYLILLVGLYSIREHSGHYKHCNLWWPDSWSSADMFRGIRNISWFIFARLNIRYNRLYYINFYRGQQ